jgi:hypothetical protein
MELQYLWCMRRPFVPGRIGATGHQEGVCPRFGRVCIAPSLLVKGGKDVRKSLILIAAACLLFACGAGRVLADPMEWTTSFTTLASQTATHDDLDPWKGSATITVTNNTGEWWTDFHFGIFSVQGSNISATTFVEGSGMDPTSSQSGLTWVINNNPAGATMDLYFASNPVAPNATATFVVYTDNSTFKQRFGMLIYPTIPEPGSLLAFASGLIGFAGIMLRRRR